MKKNKFKYSYVTKIGDKSPREQGFDGYNNNWKEMVYCKCGNRFETILVPIEEEIYFDNITTGKREKKTRTSNHEFHEISCPSCNEIYGDHSELIILGNYINNINNANAKCFEGEKSITLYSFVERMGVSKNTKNLFFKEERSFLTFSKKNRAFYINGKFRGIQRIGLRELMHQSSFIFYDFQVNYRLVGEVDMAEFSLRFESQIKLFLQKLSTYINDKDVEKIDELISDKYSKEISEAKTDKAKKDSIIKMFHTKTEIYIALIYYPFLANILFIKGLEFFLELFNSRLPLSSISYLKKQGSTSPHKVFEDLIKGGLLERRIKSRNPMGFINYAHTSRKRIKRMSISKFIFKNINTTKDIDCIINYASFNEYLNDTLRPEDMQSFIMKYGFKDFSRIVDEVERYYRRRQDEDAANLGPKDFHHIFDLSKTIDNTEKDKGTFNFLTAPKAKTLKVGTYVDVKRMMTQLGLNNEEIFDIKKWDTVCELHDDLSERIKNIKLEKHTAAMVEALKEYNSMEREINNVRFELIRSAEGLERESQELSHCVRSYANRVAEGKCLIFKVETDSEEEGSRATMELNTEQTLVDGQGKTYTYVKGLSFSQLKAKYNRRASKKIIEAAKDFCEQVKVDIDNFHLKSGDLFLEGSGKSSHYYGGPVNAEIPDVPPDEADIDNREDAELPF